MKLLGQLEPNFAGIMFIMMSSTKSSHFILIQ